MKSFDDIAEEMGVSRESVRRTYHQAMKKLATQDILELFETPYPYEQALDQLIYDNVDDYLYGFWNYKE